MTRQDIEYILCLIAKRYAANKEGAICGDSTCIGIQCGCQLIVDDFAEDHPEYPVKETFTRIVNILIEN